MDLFIIPLFTIGPLQVVVIIVVALIVFGPVGLGKKLGGLVKGTGQGVKEFKKALEEGDEDTEKKED
ncbi:MAG: twin-arginine translocase TatA/TatE family subunit [Flavobacteriaceae bacterium]|jgi:sec-independent protein translocase protein TatA|nr:twin-arginine translocase TatA/TatE family subunit [Flavobacteriaceae bacterium]RCL68453.1 MAG: twin-arginine translocase TatA/TatE family subunit [Bacteroidota bacterium]|tara:strand:- start:1306 stop:1506 length:201 start_codon:yes stop_codon:yes gene_type:complete